MALHKMAAVDAAWYHMDGRANLAMVTGLALTSEPLDFEQVCQLYEERLRAYPRFRQRVVERGRPVPVPHWQDMKNFDIRQHLHHVALPRPGDHRALAVLLSDIASAPLDRLQPLWQVHVIDGVGQGSALVMRFHHCIGDGTAMIGLSQRLFDATPDAPLQLAAADEVVEEAHDEAGAGARAGGLVGTVSGVIGRSTSVVTSAVDTVAHPRKTMERVVAVAAGAGMLVGELLKPDDPDSPFKGPFTLAKRVAWSEPVAIADVKAIGALTDSKVNDVLTAGMAGALRAYLQDRGVDVGDTTLRAMVPVNLRPPERALELGNDFGLVVLELPVGADDPLERLRLTTSHMAALKRSPEPMAMRLLFDIFGRTTKAMTDVPNALLTSKASMVLSNVMGARDRLYVSGVPIERVMFWVPHPGDQMGLGVSILSYCGHATLAIVTDAHLVPDPETITAYFEREFVTLLEAARGAGAAD